MMDWKNKNALVTGGSGFIGSHLVDRLLELGANVTILDAVPPKTKEQAQALVCDISKKENIKIDSNVDFIFHLAALAYPKACNENPSLAFNINVSGTMNMLSLAVEKEVKKFVFPSSAQLYGRYPKYLPVDEKHPIEYEGNFYNITKKFGEDLCRSFYEIHGLPVTFFRLFNSFGPRQSREYLIPTIIHQALEKKVIELWNEKPTRDFTFVTDTVNAFIRAAESTYCGGPINIGSGTETQVGDIARQIASTLGAEIKFMNKEVIGSMRMCCDRGNAKKILGWEPEISFKEGLNRAISFFRDGLSQPKP